MFNKNNIIPNQTLTQYYPFKTEQFLREVGSTLAGFVVDGFLATELIDEVCQAESVDPRFVLATLQKEQSLLFAPTSKERLDWAMGYGCLDSGPKDENYRGFAKQIRAAVRGIKSYLDPNHPYYIGDLVGREWKVSDGMVKCENAATACLYRYTPWIGDRDFGGYEAPFGNFLFYRVWTDLFGAIVYNDVPVQPDRSWLVIAPPDNWRNPVPVNESEMEKFYKVAESLDLIRNKNFAQKKLYLGVKRQTSETPAEPDVSTGEKVKYSSGAVFETIDDSPWTEPGADYWTPHPEVAAPLIQITDENRKTKLSDHFVLEEFVCRDPSYSLVRVSPRLIEKLEELRKAAGGYPMTVTSAHRPYPYNAMLDGAVSNSCHIDGVAADVYVNEVSTTELGTLAARPAWC